MKYQGRGPTYLAEVDANGGIGPFKKLCTDTFSVGLAVENWEHINKCGPVDAVDASGQKSVSGTLSLSFSDVEDLNFARAVLGTVVAAEVSPTAVTGEEFADDMIAGDYWFLGGAEQNRNITALTITDSASPPASLTLGTHYALDAASGRVDILSVAGKTQPFVAAYSHQNPASVSLLSAPQKSYFVRMEALNKQTNEDGSVELYLCRFNPASNIDFQSDEGQILELTASVLADQNRPIDPDFGQFGRRVL